MADKITRFIRLAVPGAQRGQREFGVPASVTIAQGALESGWGTSHIGTANNYFGIKALGNTPGSIAVGSVVVPTKGVHRRADGDGQRALPGVPLGRRLVPRPRPVPALELPLRAGVQGGERRERVRPGAAGRRLRHRPAIREQADRHDAGEQPLSLRRRRRAHQARRPGEAAPAGGERPARRGRRPARPQHASAQAGSPELLAVDGVWDTYTDRAFRRVCRMLGIPPKRGARAFRIIAGANVQLAPEEIARAQTEGAAFAAELSAQFHAHKPPDPPPADATVVGGTPLDARRRRAAYIAALQRDLNTQLARLGAPRPLDVDGEWGPDTDLAFRRVCKILGLAPERKIRTFRAIAGATAHRTAEEVQEGDSDGAAYAAKLRAHFHTEQRQPLDPTDDDHDDDHSGEPKPPAPRTFRIQSPLMEGEDIRAFQQVINARFEVWKVTRTIEVDGEYGSITRHAARQVAHGMGLAKRDYPGGITPEMRLCIRTPSRRSPEEKERA